MQCYAKPEVPSGEWHARTVVARRDHTFAAKSRRKYGKETLKWIIKKKGEGQRNRTRRIDRIRGPLMRGGHDVASNNDQT